MSAMSDAFLNEFEHESIGTRKTLERLPANLYDYKPHEKCFSARQLADHIVEMQYWGITTLTQTEFNITSDYKTPESKNTADMLARYDKLKAEFIEALKKTSDAQFFEMWSLKSNGAVVLSMPRVAVLRTFIFSHTIHHRAQLGLYLRLNNIPVPSIYGPSADEKM